LEGEVLHKIITTPVGEVVLSVSKNGKSGELFLVEFQWDNDQLSFAEVLHHAGILPLPPYLNRDTEEIDEQRYQTVYAKVQGSVAAPTAGLHFTDRVFAQLATNQIQTDEVTLHVGAGTFKPVKSDTLADHEMHEETIFVGLNTLQNILHCLVNHKPIIAVGTTSMRTLESLYWHGVKIIQKLTNETVAIKQWDAYDIPSQHISPKRAIEAIINDLEQRKEDSIQGSTQIIIAPGYSFKLVDILITNFHQPENTLILLIAAFVGEDWKVIYNYAINNNYRFLSYGDSSVLWRKNG
jgi:S-adenosylmethionine:tRNA ribosyltransferase-isomerase